MVTGALRRGTALHHTSGGRHSDAPPVALRRVRSTTRICARDHGFHSLVMRRKYVLWRYALVCERLRCEPWRPWGWGETTRGPRRPARRGVGH